VLPEPWMACALVRGVAIELDAGLTDHLSGNTEASGRPNRRNGLPDADQIGSPAPEEPARGLDGGLGAV